MNSPDTSAIMRARIYVHGSHGYVWDAAEAHWLRLECGLVGAMVGGVAGFKQQNAVHSLPLQLCQEEVTLVLEKGWGVLMPDPGVASQAVAAAASRKRARSRRSGFHSDSDDQENDEIVTDAKPPPWRDALKGDAFTIPIALPHDGSGSSSSSGGMGAGGAPGESSTAAAFPAAEAAAAAAVDAAGAPAAGTGAAAGHLPGGARSMQQASPAAAEAAATAAAAAAAQPSGEAEARTALGPNVGGIQQDGEGEAQQAQHVPQAHAVSWSFPATQQEHHRYWVFRDLHQAGYRITAGSKFGADFLLYPGDPTLFHAQFCVRMLPYRTRLLPALLAAASRGSHMARKHLLIASVEQGPSGGTGVTEEAGSEVAPGPGAAGSRRARGGEGYRIHYMTIGPMEGFG